MDTTLLSRLIAAFADIPARFIVNVGGYFESYDSVPDNVFLGDWFPQPSVVAHSDLFIHHGGNNSFCEALYHGVPSLVMSYCWDGHDNAQRAAATGVGARLDRALWTPESLRATIMSLLGNDSLRRRLKEISEDMQRTPGTERAAVAVMAMLTRQQDEIIPNSSRWELIRQ